MAQSLSAPAQRRLAGTLARSAIACSSPSRAAAPHRRHTSPRHAATTSPKASTTQFASKHRAFGTCTARMAPIPSTMKVVQISANGGVEVLQHADVPVPKPAPNQVLIKNQYAGINFIDTYFRTGLYKAPAFPYVLGREGAGEIVAVGSSVDASLKFKEGDHVVFSGDGAYAEFIAIEAARVVAIPDGVDAKTAAAALLQGLTALTFIREAAAVQPGQWTLVHAAAGGVGSILVQILKAVGAKIIATASTDEKLALAKQYGADHLIKSSDDVVAKVKEITGGHGIDAIFDGVGKATFEADLQIVALNGYLVSFGNASGAVPPISILQLSPKNVKLMRPVVNHYVADRKNLEKYTGELFDLILSKKVIIAEPAVYALKDAGQAHSDIESRKTTGKLLLKL